MRISDQVVVLNFGMLVTAGTPDDVRRNPDVIAAYLGDDADEIDQGIRA
jgi:ABC-type branched-subunit amino acid transport system ATPase component